VHNHPDGTEIITDYAEFTGRLVYTTIREPGRDESRRVLGAGKLDRVLAAISR
jgi:hypothetical protein